MNWKQYLLIVLWLTGAFVYSEYSQAGDLRITTINNSKHFKDSEKYNENHDGLGMEFQTGTQSWVGVNFYKNSFNDEAALVYYSHEHQVNSVLSYGFQYGTALGYSDPILYAGIYGQYNPAPTNLYIPSARATIIPGVVWSSLIWEFD